MKNIIGLAFACLFFTSIVLFANNKNEKSTEKNVISNTSVTTENTSLAAIAWDHSVHNFGEVKQGEPVTCEFTLTNTGKEPLIITDVKKSCGCTVSSFPKAPIAPGESEIVTAEYNAKNPGAFSKTLTVLSNAASATQRLTIKGNVVESKN